MTTNVLLILFTYFCLPETKNVTLEQMDVLFGDVDHVAKGAGFIDEPTAPVSLGDKPEAVALETVPKKESV